MAVRKINISQLAELSGVSRTTISNLYNEKSKNINSSTLIKIANALEVSVDELLGLKGGDDIEPRVEAVR